MILNDGQFRPRCRKDTAVVLQKNAELIMDRTCEQGGSLKVNRKEKHTFTSPQKEAVGISRQHKEERRCKEFDIQRA